MVSDNNLYVEVKMKVVLISCVAPILAKDADYNVYFNNAAHTPLRCCNSTHTV